jgi:hypothetical protein
MISEILLSICLAIFPVVEGFSANESITGPDKQNSGTVKVNYTVSDEVIFNPERGHYTHKTVANQNSAPLSPDVLKSIRDDQKISLVFTIYYLGEFIDKPISDKMLQIIETNMNNLRNTGLKCVLRFAYKSNVKNEPWDSPLGIINQHIKQLKPLLQKNGDVIASMEAGFIGVWGEWYYSTNFGFPAPDYSKRKLLIDTLLDALPSDRMICLRTPVFKMKLFEINPDSYLTEQNAHSHVPIARIGHHNDCFLANNDDYGTYQKVDAEKSYLENDSRYVVVGGETCNPSNYAECFNTLREMERFHWSYLNIDYNRDVINNWKSEKCYDEIVRRLGYRFFLIEGQFNKFSTPGGSISMELSMTNSGFAAPFNSHKAEIIIENDSGVLYKAVLPDDPCRWMPGKFSLKAEIGIPDDAPQGNYTLFLHLSPPEKTLYINPFYSIRLANEGTWDAKRGFNRLTTFKINKSTRKDKKYSGKLVFEPFSLK